MAKQNRIGFLIPGNTSNDKENSYPAKQNTQPKQPDELEQILLKLYMPCPTAAESDDMLEGFEIFEAIAAYCETEREFLFTTLINLGFLTITIENTLYWLVKYN